MSNMLDMLLGAGEEILERPVGELEVSRLSKKLGQKFMIQTRALTHKEFEDVKTGDEGRLQVILKGTTDPDFKSEALRKKYTPAGRKTPLTPPELLKVLFLPGEIFNIYNAISELSGFSDEAVVKKVEEIEKN